MKRFGGESGAEGTGSMLGIGIALGRVWVAGDMIGRTAVGSKPSWAKRSEKDASLGSSGNVSLIRFSNLIICASSP